MRGLILERKATRILIDVPRGVPRELAAEYLERCRSGLPFLEAAVAQNQHEQMRIRGHRMKGTGAPYGFSRLTEIGGRIEKAAADHNSSALRGCIAELAEYLSQVEIAGE
jgi:HPt (histidine-containing phosphotransfer) domain-containing protein